MSREEKINPEFCLTEEWAKHLPQQLQSMSEADWRARSRAGSWPNYCTLLSQKSPALWRKSEILAYFKLKFSLVHPECVQALITAGFGQAQVHNKRRSGRV
jgi:hypothetical protein